MRWVILALALTGCTSVRYVPCPTLVTYSTTDQQALASEITAHPQPQTIRWIGDYIGLRDQVRACSKN
ncbi:hypothetical protein GRO01_26830 [Gluconobacter roseus NBRC 3990]|uniref:Uncharacterized protein n=1 Tax=Gluconobacter roseus NBRC 3990 TaxID=1307950 RepID=A0A4Y3M9B5_9PROT|nr:hypothetical protein AD943_00135 [Gluconobacter roseus]GBR46605.1 hypothetical protein AA3990_1495 [Gluconobacter roseus NBRC 3990]GEB05107.1 hypothetical protein GRO01_26830 [Gluconobacter roseus NBRC 3990]GLP94615.1 hypothetical protein GCM10007871_25930 [Gluconobacter roseus NBRC 3990]